MTPSLSLQNLIGQNSNIIWKSIPQIIFIIFQEILAHASEVSPIEQVNSSCLPKSLPKYVKMKVNTALLNIFFLLQVSIMF